MALIATSDLLTLKKTICVANLSEDEVNTPEQSRHYMAVKQLADEEGSPNFYVRIHSICFLFSFV